MRNAASAWHTGHSSPLRYPQDAVRLGQEPTTLHPYPTAPEAKILMEAFSSGLPRGACSHPKLSICSSPFLNELVEQMGFVPWLTSIPVFALEPVRQQKCST